MSELEGVLRLLDTNGDGSVDVEEFLDRLGFGADEDAAGDADSGGRPPYAVITLRNALRRFQLAIWEDEREDRRRRRLDSGVAVSAAASRQSGETGPLRRLFDKYAEEVGGVRGRSARASGSDAGIARVGGARRKQGVGGRGGDRSGQGQANSSDHRGGPTTKVLTAGQLRVGRSRRSCPRGRTTR